MKKGVLALVFFLYYLAAVAQVNAFGLLYGQGRGEGDPFTKRYVITSVYPGSPAARAGIMVGDEIVSVNGTTVLNKTTQEVRNLFAPERAEIKILRNNEEYIGTFEKADLDIDTAFLADVDQLTKQADSNFILVKGPEREEALVYDSKIQLTTGYRTVLKKHLMFKQYDLFGLLYSGDSRREAEKVYSKYEKQLSYYWGSRAYSQKYRSNDDTTFLQQTYFSKKLLNGFETYRTTLAANISQQTHQYEVALVIEGGPKPVCTFVKPDTAQTARDFRETVQYLLLSFNNNKAVENIAGEVLPNDSTSYQSKYCFNHATSCYLLNDTYEQANDTIHNQRKYHFSAEYKWLNAKQADSLFNGLYIAISNSLNGGYVRYEKAGELAQLLNKKNVVFALDRDHLMPSKEHAISLFLDDNKNNDYTVRIEIE